MDSFPYPTGTVVAVVTGPAAVEDARTRLTDAGFAADAITVLHGEDGLARIDVEGETHGTLGTLIRRLQSVFSEDADHVHRYADHLRAGDWIVGVGVGSDEAAKERAAAALRPVQPTSLDYFAETFVEDLAATP
jgi:hypothetical protein